MAPTTRSRSAKSKQPSKKRRSRSRPKEKSNSKSSSDPLFAAPRLKSGPGSETWEECSSGFCGKCRGCKRREAHGKPLTPRQPSTKSAALNQPPSFSITALCASNLPWGETSKSIWVAVSFAAYLPLIPATWHLSHSYCLSSWWGFQIFFGVFRKESDC